MAGARAEAEATYQATDAGLLREVPRQPLRRPGEEAAPGDDPGAPRLEAESRGITLAGSATSAADTGRPAAN